VANQNKAAKKPLTKSQLFQSLAEQTGLTKAQVAEVFDALGTTIQKQIGRNSAGSINAIPGLIKIVKVKKPATPARKNVKNPFTGEFQDRPAKPATNVVKVRTLKGLKDMV
jgi:nucleoid DNA-binding protein